jgi:hypothetical protein
MRVPRPIGIILLIVAASIQVACANYRQALNRGQQLYEENDYERALAVFRTLEDDMDSLSLNERARYAYLRGMTGYRLGFRPDARHWLAIARSTEQQHPGGLTSAWRSRIDEALADLNRDVFSGGEVARESPTTPAQGSPAQASDRLPTGTCISASDCAPSQLCQNNVCVGR